MSPSVASLVAAWPASPFGAFDLSAWEAVRQVESLVRAAIRRLGEGYEVSGDVAIHRSATVESPSTIKGPAIVGPGCFIAAMAYLRGGVFLDQDCTVGPGTELKSSFLFKGSKLAHFNFIGDSIVGAAVNLEAGSIIANYRNESGGAPIRIVWQGRTIETGLAKFGALVGDGTRIGANAVIAPGAILARNTIIGRLALHDQSPGD